MIITVEQSWAPRQVMSEFLVSAVVLGTALVAGPLMVQGSTSLTKLVAVLLGLVAAAGLALVAAFRFQMFLLVLFVLRPALDAFKGSGGVLDPSLAVGGMFLLVGSLWLAAQLIAGQFAVLSWTSRALVALVLADAMSVLASADHVASAVAVAKVASGALMFIVLEQVLAQDTRYARRLLAAVAASLVVPALTALGQWVQARGLSDTARIRGTFVHPNSFASYLVLLGLSALALAPHLDGRERLLARAMTALCIPLLLVTYGRAAWLAFLVGVLVVGALQSRRLVAGCLVSLVLVATLVPAVSARLADLGSQRQVGRGDPNSLAFRFRYWQEIAPYANSTPIVGIGLDMVERTAPEQLLPHNTFLEAYVETGLLGLGALLVVVWAIARDLTGALRRARGPAVAGVAAAVGFGVQLGTENLLLQALLLWYLAVPITVACRRAERAEPS